MIHFLLLVHLQWQSFCTHTGNARKVVLRSLSITSNLELDVKVVYIKILGVGDLSSMALGLDTTIDEASTGNEEFKSIFSQGHNIIPALYDQASGLKLNQTVVINRYLLSLARNQKGLLGDEAYNCQILMWTNRIFGVLPETGMRNKRTKPSNSSSASIFFLSAHSFMIKTQRSHCHDSK